ncbi:unnamed protein product [Closterium sp. NIES-54]
MEDISSPAFSPDPDVRLFKLQRGGLTATITNLGATVTSLTVPDARGQLHDIALGFDTAQPYQDGTSPYFGCVVGRVANRIAGAQFNLNGQIHHLTANDDPRPNTLHGGKVGFDKRIWRVVATDEIDKIVPTVSSSAGAAAAEEGGAAGSSTELNLALTSGDGEEGFPGRVEVRVSYRLGDGEMVVVMAAHAVDRDTPVSMAHHMLVVHGGVCDPCHITSLSKPIFPIPFLSFSLHIVSALMPCHIHTPEPHPPHQLAISPSLH